MSSLLRLNILDDSVHDQPKYVQRLCARFYSLSACTSCSYITVLVFFRNSRSWHLTNGNKLKIVANHMNLNINFDF